MRTLNSLNSCNFWPQLSCQHHTLNQSNCLVLQVVSVLPSTVRENDIAMLTGSITNLVYSTSAGSPLLLGNWFFPRFLSLPQLCNFSHAPNLTFNLHTPPTEGPRPPPLLYQNGLKYLCPLFTPLFLRIGDCFLSQAIPSISFFSYSTFTKIWCLSIDNFDHHCCSYLHVLPTLILKTLLFFIVVKNI